MGERASLVKDEETEVKVEFDFGSVEEKRDKIQQACRDRDLNMIASLALSTDGLLADDIRQEVWPLFLGYADFTHDGITPANPLREDWEKLPPHKDEDQVRLDVDRSFVYYPKMEAYM